MSDDPLRATTEPSSEDKDRVIAAMYGVDPNDIDFRSQVLDKLRIEFERAPNPMLPWNALKWARDRGLDIPRWVIDHLCDKAVVLEKIVIEDVGEEEAQEVGRALGFGAEGKGKTTAGAKLRQRRRDFITAVHIADLRMQDVAKENAITETATAVSVSPATAYLAHKGYGGTATRFVATLMKWRFHKSGNQ
jgi:hypothetical protein